MKVMLNLPNFPELTAISEADKKQIQDFTDLYPPYSDFNYVSLYSWDTTDDGKVSVLNGNLVVLYKDYLSSRHFISFMGDSMLEETAQTLLEYALTKETIDNSLHLIPEPVAALLSQKETFFVKEDSDNNDYILSPAQYSSLEGKQFRYKRKNINRFKRKYGADISHRLINLYDPDEHKNVLELSRQWLDFETEGSKYASNEILAIERLLMPRSEIDIIQDVQCFGLYYKDTLIAFCIYEILPDGWSITHFGKSNLSYHNSYEYMMAELLKLLDRNGIQKVNNEQDLGIAGLRIHKKAQQPIGYLKKYTVELKKH